MKQFEAFILLCFVGIALSDYCGDGACEQTENCFSCSIDCGLCDSYSCDPRTCKLPACQCCSTQIPANLSLVDTPQFVWLSFDDYLSEGLWKDMVGKVLTESAHDILGHGPRATIFACIAGYSDFSKVRAVKMLGGEVGAHSFTHATSHHTPQRVWSREIASTRKYLKLFGSIDPSEVAGFRAPFLDPNMYLFRALIDEGIEYDSSLTAPYNMFAGFAWPCTLDNGFLHEKWQPQRVAGSFPGLWEIPVTGFNPAGDMYADCSMDPPPTDPDELTERLIWTFDMHYTTNRAPMNVALHGLWFYENASRVGALLRFFQYVVTKPGTFYATGGEIIDWMKNPEPVHQYMRRRIAEEAPPQPEPKPSEEICDGIDNDRNGIVDDIVTHGCNYKTIDGATFSFSTCNECPKEMPHMEGAAVGLVTYKITVTEIAPPNDYRADVHITNSVNAPVFSWSLGITIQNGGVMNKWEGGEVAVHGDSSWLVTNHTGALIAPGESRDFTFWGTRDDPYSVARVTNIHAWIFF